MSEGEGASSPPLLRFTVLKTGEAAERRFKLYPPHALNRAFESDAGRATRLLTRLGRVSLAVQARACQSYAQTTPSTTWWIDYDQRGGGESPPPPERG